MSDDYFEDYSKIPIPLSSLFKTYFVRRCNWCYNIIKNIEGEEITGPDRWCSKECKQEEKDWIDINKLKRDKESSRRIWKEKHPIRIRVKSNLTRKEYLKKYFKEHRDKKREQSKLAMIRYRIKRLKNK